MTLLQFEHRCPWCKREVDFSFDGIHGWSPDKSTDYDRFMPMLNKLVRDMPKDGVRQRPSVSNPRGPFNYEYNPPVHERDNVRAWSTVSCPKCGSPTMFVFDASVHWLMGHWSRHVGSSSAKVEFQDVPLAARTQTAHGRIRVLFTFPSLGTADVPNGMPEAAASIWPATLRSLDAGDPPSRIVSECRSVLDVCLKDLDAKGSSRKKCILDLRDRYVLTEGMAQWAQKVWDEGNDAVHDIVATRAQAEQLVAFLKVFLHVVYELPAEIKQKEPSKPTSVASKTAD